MSLKDSRWYNENCVFVHSNFYLFLNREGLIRKFYAITIMLMQE